MCIVYLNIGLPETRKDRHNEDFVTAIAKQSSQGSLLLTASGLDGDDTYDVVHGTPDRGMHVFSHEHYAFFAERAGAPLEHCAFGENLCVTGLTEHDVCVGDTWQLGEAVVQVSMPTERCSTIGRRLHMPNMLQWIHERMMTGYYLRILQPGMISAAATITLLERPHPQWSVDRLNQLLFKQRDRQQMAQACALPELSEEWKQRAWQLYDRAGV
ncbi:MAG TPA: MOSC domain-containing protein [Oceanospirillaceae bacterium]|nr:MOSC domain-containing protein [Oceanospirillaceae bacterium]